jgi:hypothetical protein
MILLPEIAVDLILEAESEQDSILAEEIGLYSDRYESFEDDVTTYFSS